MSCECDVGRARIDEELRPRSMLDGGSESVSTLKDLCLSTGLGLLAIIFFAFHPLFLSDFVLLHRPAGNGPCGLGRCRVGSMLATHSHLHRSVRPRLEAHEGPCGYTRDATSTNTRFHPPTV